LQEKQELLVLKENVGDLDKMADLENRDFVERVVSQVLLVLQVHWVLQDYRDSVVPMVNKDRKEDKDLKDPKEGLDSVDNQEHVEQLAQLVLMVNRVPRDLLVLLVLLGREDRMGLLARRVLLGK
jgi:hypothetical protein